MSKKDILKKLTPEEKELFKQIRQRIEIQGLHKHIIEHVTSSIVIAALLREVLGNRLDDPQLIACLQWIWDKFSRDKYVKRK